MAFSVYELLPWLAGGLFVVFAVWVASERPTRNLPWYISALLAVIFAGWTMHAAVAEGMTGFWDEHRRGAWANQIWFDLLIAAAMAFTLLLPRARAARMHIWPWLILVIATGSIGLAAMFARCLYLEQSRAAARLSEGATP